MYFKIDENNRVVVKVFGKAAEALEADNVTSFKVESEPTVEANEILYYNPENAEFYTEQMPEPTEEMKARAVEMGEAQKKKANALKWLSDNDWKVNKRVLGEWAETDERWVEYLEQRKAVRADYDSAVFALKWN